jgi:hypothetical protein
MKDTRCAGLKMLKGRPSLLTKTQVYDFITMRLGLKSPISAALSASSTGARVFFFKGVS